MELLAREHWIAVHENEQAKTDPDAAVAGVLEWNEHKSRTFTSKRIMAAWDYQCSTKKDTGDGVSLGASICTLVAKVERQSFSDYGLPLRQAFQN